jgi:hypothetical protein
MQIINIGGTYWASMRGELGDRYIGTGQTAIEAITQCLTRAGYVS